MSSFESTKIAYQGEGVLSFPASGPVERTKKEMCELEEIVADAILRNDSITSTSTSKVPNKVSSILNEYLHQASRRLVAVMKRLALHNSQDATSALDKVLKMLTELGGGAPVKNYAGNIGYNPHTNLDALNSRETNLRTRAFLLGEVAKRDYFKNLFKDKDVLAFVNGDLIGFQLSLNEKFEQRGACITPNGLDLRVFKKTIVQKRQTEASQKETGRIPASEQEIKHATEGQKENPVVMWDTGEAVFEPVTKDNIGMLLAALAADKVEKLKPFREEYLENANKYNMPLMAGPSNSVHQFLSTLHALGMLQGENLQKGVMVALALFIDNKAHTAIEILTAARSFGFKFVIGSNWHTQVDPNNKTGFQTEMIERLAKSGLKST